MSLAMRTIREAVSGISRFLANGREQDRGRSEDVKGNINFCGGPTGERREIVDFVPATLYRRIRFVAPGQKQNIVFHYRAATWKGRVLQ